MGMNGMERDKFRRLGLSDAEAETWFAAGIGPWTCDAFRDAGITSLDEALRWTVAGISGNAAMMMRKTRPVDLDEAREWHATGMPWHDIYAAIIAGRSPQDCRAEVEARTREAEEHIRRNEAKRFAQRYEPLGFTLAEARPWMNAAVEPHLAWELQQRGRQPDAAEPWAKVKADAPLIGAWIDAGFTPNTLPDGYLVRAGVAPDDYLRWVAAGFTPAEVVRHAVAGRTVAEAQQRAELEEDREARLSVIGSTITEPRDDSEIEPNSGVDWNSVRSGPQLFTMWEHHSNADCVRAIVGSLIALRCPTVLGIECALRETARALVIEGDHAIADAFKIDQVLRSYWTRAGATGKPPRRLELAVDAYEWIVQPNQMAERASLIDQDDYKFGATAIAELTRQEVRDAIRAAAPLVIAETAARGPRDALMHVMRTSDSGEMSHAWLAARGRSFVVQQPGREPVELAADGMAEAIARSTLLHLVEARTITELSFNPATLLPADELADLLVAEPTDDSEMEIDWTDARPDLVGTTGSEDDLYIISGLTARPVYVNGDRWAVTDDGHIVPTDIDRDFDMILPALDSVWGSWSLTCEASRTSGTDAAVLGPVTPSLLCEISYPDDAVPQARFWSRPSDPAASLLKWLRQDFFADALDQRWLAHVMLGLLDGEDDGFFTVYHDADGGYVNRFSVMPLENVAGAEDTLTQLEAIVNEETDDARSWRAAAREHFHNDNPRNGSEGWNTANLILLERDELDRVAGELRYPDILPNKRVAAIRALSSLIREHLPKTSNS